MSILLTSPAFLLAFPAIRWGFGLSRLVTGAALAVLIVALVNLMHFSQGWVQFGYRFALDFTPWAFLFVAIGLERIARRTDRRSDVDGAGARVTTGVGAWAIVTIALVLVGISVFVNLWGVVWGDVLGW
jgi:hypothetical protein